MSWNYRILKKPYELGYHYTIIEVYYDKEEKIWGWSEGDKILDWDNTKDLEGTIKQLQRVIGTPILEEKDDTLVEVAINQKEENKNGEIHQSNS